MPDPAPPPEFQPPEFNPADYDPADLGRPAPKPPGSIPTWLAIAVVLLILGGVGYWLFFTGRPAKPVDLTQYQSNDTGRFGFAPQRPAAEGVTLDAEGVGQIRTAGLSVRFSVFGKKPSVVAANLRPRDIDPQERTAIVAREWALSDPARRRAANVTGEQFTKLRSVPALAPPVLDDATRLRLLELWTKRQAAPAGERAKVETQMLDAVQQAARANADAAAKSSRATAEAVRAVLSAEQIVRLRQRPEPASRPATRAATRPASRPTARR